MTTRISHLVGDEKMAESYRKGGWTVTEVRPGVWEVVNPKEIAAELAEERKKGAKK